uniref:Neur_chan_memb domain-containing protein n=1 Tax=Angiostrongylus cantonensis TaxID=6313 RepID=A0A0K0DIU1_ANGCA
LTMSVAEFVMSLAVNGVCVVIVIFFYWRLTGKFTSDKPAQPRHRSSISRPFQPAQYNDGAPVQEKRIERPASRCSRPPSDIPDWREQWPDMPDPPLRKKLRRRERRSRSDPRTTSVHHKGDNGSLDFFAPEPYDVQFPWKIEKMKRERRGEARPHTAAEDIERLYYSRYPDEIPGIPHGMRSSLRRERKGGRSPDRVTFSTAEPQVNYTTPQHSSKSSVV